MKINVLSNYEKGKLSARIREFNTRNITKKSVALNKKRADRFIKIAKENYSRYAYNTGRLSESIGNPSKDGIYRVSPQGLSIEVGTKVDYALTVENGADAYTIYPVNAKRLRFVKNGKVIFTTHSKIPKRQGKYILTMSAIETKAVMETI